MSTPYIEGKLKGTVFDPNALPVKSGTDQIAEGAGGLLANLPLLFAGGPELKAASEVPEATTAFGKWLADTALGRWGTSIGKGAVAGGAGAAIETPGDLSERAKAGAVGAATGATIGAVVPPAVAGAQWIADHSKTVDVAGLPNKVSPAAVSNAGDKLSDNLGTSGVADVQAAATKDANQGYTPGYSPTIGQIVDNPKTVLMEQQARAADKGAFTAKADAQTQSEKTAINKVGGDGNISNVAPALEAGQQQIATQGDIDSEAARDQLRQAQTTLPNPAFQDVAAGQGAPATTSSQAYGADTRATVLTAKQAVSDQVGQLQSSVNADGNVVVPTGSVQKTLGTTYDLNPSAKPPDAAEADIRDTIKGWGSNVPLADVDTMRQRISSEVDQRIKDGATRTTPDVVRLQQLKAGLDRSVDDGANLAGTSPTLQASPTASTDAAPITPKPTTPTPPMEPLKGTNAAPQDLASFLISKGGVVDQTGDLKAMGADAIHHKGAGRLINPNGVSPDYAREAAEEAGYLRPNSTINDLYDAIGEQVSGRPVFTQSEQAEGMLRKQAARQQALQDHRYTQAREDVGQVEDGTGVRLNEDDADAAAKLVAQGMHPADAHEAVVRSREDQALQQNAEHNAIGAPGVPEAARQMAMPDITGGKLPSSPRYFTPDEVAARAKVKDLNQQLASTYGNGPVGDILGYGDYDSGAAKLVSPDMTRTKGGFATQDADVMAKVWDGSRNENANVQQFVKAGGDLDKLKSYAADDLRTTPGAIDAEGNLDPAKYAAWRNQHRAGLNSTPELRGAFDGVDQAQNAVQQAAETTAANLKAYQSDVVGKFLGRNPDAAVKSMFETGDSGANTKDILAKFSGNKDAENGLQRAVGDYIGDTYKPLSQTASTIADADKAKAFDGFLTKNQDALTQLYGDGYATLQRVAQQQADRSSTANSALRAAPPSSGAAGGHHPVDQAGLVKGELLAEGITHMIDQVPVLKHAGVVAGGVSYVIGALRRVGVKTEGQLLNLAALNPTTVGKQLLDATAAKSARITPQMSRRLTAAIGAAAADQYPRPKL